MRTVGALGGFVLAVALCLAAAGPALAQYDQIIHAFNGDHDGGFPVAGVTMDSAGNLYGTTIGGGDAGCGRSGGCGTVFKITPDGTESVLYAYDRTDGAMPESVPYVDAAGDIYVTTVKDKRIGYGTLMKIAPDGQATILHEFCQTKACPDGGGPTGKLIADKSGDLFGVAYVGGPDADGVIYEITSGGQYQIIYAIGEPLASGYFARDAHGNFYVATGAGGANYGGTILKVSAAGAGEVLYNFGRTGDGAGPTGVTIDGAHDLYGFTQAGGADDAGTVFKIDSHGVETLLYSFTGGTDGMAPAAAPVLDSTGNIYGVANLGGSNSNGAVFELARGHKLKVLHDFANTPDGAQPSGQLFLTGSGALYGTTFYGGSTKWVGCRYAGCGVVFALNN